MQPAPFPITLKDAYMISAKVKHLIFQATNPFTFLPGQFITVHFVHGDKNLKRSYSIANSPSPQHGIEFAAGFFPGGPGTELLFNLKPGETIWITGPYGRLILKDTIPKRYIFIATSTGITPYRSMLQELQQRLENHPSLEVLILEGVQKREDILYAADFASLNVFHPRFTFKPCLSKETHVHANEYKGYVQRALTEIELYPQEDVVYLCGNPAMVDETFSYLKDQNFNLHNIIREKYISR